ncbi:MAG: hypothetical protein Fur002_04320 [Anaerolineales bacterium]
MFRWIAENYRTFLWAFALALAVWVAAVTAADPDETRTLRASIPIEVIGLDPGMVIRGEVPAALKLTLRAPHSIWNILDADPQSARAILDLSGLSAGAHTLDVQIQINARPVQIIAASPRSVTLTLEALTSKSVTLDAELVGEVAIGYQAGSLDVAPQEVILSGAQSQVEKVARARIAVNIGGAREDIDKTLPIELLDENGAPVSAVSVSPEAVHVQLPISQQGGYRDVAVKVNASGRVASGYRMTDISVFPPVVTVYSEDPQLVNNLPGIIETQVLDLQNAQDNITTRLTLNLPAGVSVIGDQAVLIQVGISPIESSITLSGEQVEVTGLNAGLTAQVSPAAVDVIVSGPVPVLEALARQDVRITVDLSGLGAGVYQIAPQVEALIANVKVESVLPNAIEVVITPSVTPTPQK